jgi:hypothetical protein
MRHYIDPSGSMSFLRHRRPLVRPVEISTDLYDFGGLAASARKPKHGTSTNGQPVSRSVPCWHMEYCEHDDSPR